MYDEAKAKLIERKISWVDEQLRYAHRTESFVEVERLKIEREKLYVRLAKELGKICQNDKKIRR